MKNNPQQTNKSVIAKELSISRPTVIKYYDEIVSELLQERQRSERMKQLEKDGHITVKITPSQELSDYLLQAYGIEPEIADDKSVKG